MWDAIAHDLEELDRLVADVNAQVNGNDSDNLASSSPSPVPGQSIILSVYVSLHIVCRPETEIERRMCLSVTSRCSTKTAKRRHQMQVVSAFCTCR